MAISPLFKSITSLGLSAAATTITPVIPSSPAMATGDLMICWVNIKAPTAGTTNTPAGWTKTPGEKANGNVLVVYYRFWQAGDANPAVTWTTSSKASGGIVVYTGVGSVAGGGPYSATSTSNSGTGTTATCPTITAAHMGALLVNFVGSAVVGAHASTDWRVIQRATISSSGGSTATQETSSAYDEPYFAPVATGTRAVTVVSGTWATWSLILKPSVSTTFGRRQQANGSASSPMTITLGTAPTSGKAIVAFVKNDVPASPVTGVTVGGTALVKADAGADASVEASIWYLEGNTNTGTSVVVTAGAGNSVRAIVVEFDGVVSSSALDQFGHATGVGTAVSVATGAAVASQATLSLNVVTELLTTGVLTASTGYVLGPLPAAASQPLVYEFNEIAGGSVETAAPTWAVSETWQSVIATFSSTARVTDPMPLYPRHPEQKTIYRM